MNQTLSICLATVESRAKLFALLHGELMVKTIGKPVELVVYCDNKEISIGKKRQELMERATGEYVVFIDDDDWVAPTYVDDILQALTTKPDCVGFEIECTTNGRDKQSAIASMRYKRWSDNLDGYRFNRSTYHKTPIRRDLALKVGFPNLRYAEDKYFSEGIIKLVETEVFIPKVLYYYRFNSEPFAQKYGFKNGPSEPKTTHRKLDNKGRKMG